MLKWNDTPEHHDQRMRWWRQARFGMFIHWGIYSAAGGYWKGNKIPNMGEWIMATGSIPVADYLAFAKSFNPVKFDADTWASIAADAGMRYMVITAKHHDGFAMFRTQHSPYNIVDATAYGKDPLKALSAACTAHGLQLGFYYSQAQDWTNGGASSRGYWDPAQKRDIGAYVQNVAIPQLQELLTNYQPAPKVIWWDWGPQLHNPADRAAIFNAVRAAAPDVILNDRLAIGPSDFSTWESHLPFHAPTEAGKARDWETCMTLNDTWGYRSDDTHWKSAVTLIRMLCDVKTRGRTDFQRIAIGSLDVAETTPLPVEFSATKVAKDDFIHLQEIQLVPTH